MYFEMFFSRMFTLMSNTIASGGIYAGHALWPLTLQGPSVGICSVTYWLN